MYAIIMQRHEGQPHGALTDEHAVSSYRIPVLVYDGVAYGLDDLLTVMAGESEDEPMSWRVRDLLTAYVCQDDATDQALDLVHHPWVWMHSPDGYVLAHQMLGTEPDADVLEHLREMERPQPPVDPDAPTLFA